MSSKTSNVAKGLNLLFLAELIIIISAIVSAIPALVEAAIVASLIGIASIIALVLNLVGLAKAGKDSKGFKIAFILSIASLIIAFAVVILGVALPETLLVANLVSLATKVISILITYFVVTTTVEILQSQGKNNVAKTGTLVWTLYAITVIASVILSLFLNLGILNVVTELFVVLIAILAIVGYILYLIFLYRASRSLN